VRIEIRRVETLKQGTNPIGTRVRTKIVKNKVAPPFRQAEFDIIVSGDQIGISREGDIVDLGVEGGLVKKMGAFYSYGDVRIGQGRENAKAFLRNNPDLAREIESQLRAAAEGKTKQLVAAGVGVSEDEEEDEDEL
jgi:recombination protein RecA